VGWLEGGTAILAFRGTQTAQDGLQDVKIVRQSIDHLQKMFPGTQAHSGKLSNHMHGFGMSVACATLFMCLQFHLPMSLQMNAFIGLFLHVSICLWDVCFFYCASACLLAVVYAAIPGSHSMSDSVHVGVHIV